MSLSVVYLNGKYVPEDKAKVSVFDRGFTYGDGLFETMKATDGTVAFKKEHLARLKKGIRALAINIWAIEPLFNDIRNGALEKLLKKNGLDAAAASVRISVTRGVDKHGHAPKPSCKPTTVITAKPIDDKAMALYQKQGVSAVYITGYAPQLPGIKSLNFLPNVLGKGEAARRGAMEGVFIGKDGLISEGTSTNVFIVKNGVLKTPPSETSASGKGTALPGVMRAKVCQAAVRLGITVEVSSIHADELEESDEAFLTNSILEVVPLIRIEKKPISNAARGPLTARIQKQIGLNTVTVDRDR